MKVCCDHSSIAEAGKLYFMPSMALAHWLWLDLVTDKMVNVLYSGFLLFFEKQKLSVTSSVWFTYFKVRFGILAGA